MINPNQDKYNQDNYNQDNFYSNAPYPGMPYSPEEEIKNIVGQIDPAHILDNLNHSLKGEYYHKESGSWIKIGEPLVNDVCRGWIISYFNSIMNNASTMGIISEIQLSHLMDGIIHTVTKTFRCNLERFGFIPPGKYYPYEFENKGSPNTSRMDDVTEMIYRAALLVLSRSLKGTESARIFKSLNMRDTLMFGQQEQPTGLKRFFSK